MSLRGQKLLTLLVEITIGTMSSTTDSSRRTSALERCERPIRVDNTISVGNRLGVHDNRSHRLRRRTD
jgi:hypothetical protein